MLYCQPLFRRGEGFGNRLFSWARCRVFAKKNKGQTIAPIWFRPSFGALLRGGIDYRNYLNQIVLLGLFQKGRCELGHWQGVWRTRGARLVRESEVSDLSIILDQEIAQHLLFDQAWYRFTPLLGSELFLLRELRSITRQNYLASVDAINHPFIGINVRCGRDFQSPPAVGDYYERVGWLQRTPISWFIESLAAIRKTCGYPVPAVLVSDGSEAMLREILKLENVHFLRPGCAISDLLVLAKSKTLLASATSTFSAWAAYLGGMPTINAPGHPLTEWGLVSSPTRYLGDFDPRRPNQQFLDQAAGSLEYT